MVLGLIVIKVFGKVNYLKDFMITDRFHKKIIFSIIFLFECYTGFSQSPLPGLQEAYSKTYSSKEKADISYTISTWYSDRLKIDSGLFYAKKIKELSLPASYETGIGKYHLAMALALYYASRRDEAQENTLRAIEIFNRQKEIFFLGRAYWQLATIQYVANNFIISRKNYWSAINYSVASEDQGGAFRSYFWLARLYEKTSEIDSAAFYYIKAVAKAEKLKDANRIFESAVNLGSAFLRLGEYAKAAKYLEYGLNNRQPMSNKVGIRNYLRDYATTLILLHEFKLADSAINEFKLMNEKINDDWGRVSFNKLKGVLEFEKNNYRNALTYLKEAYKERQAIKPINEIKEIVFLVGKAEYETQQYDSAIIHLRLAANLSHEVQYLIDEMGANLLLSRAFDKMNKPDSALFYFRNYSLLKDSVLSAQKQKNIIEVTTRYETGKKEQEIIILQKESEANNYLLQLNTQQLQKQELESQQKSNQLILVSKQNEINKLDAIQMTLSLDNEKKDNEKNQAKLNSLEKESALQTAIARNQKQRTNFAYGLIASILNFSGYGYYRYRQNKKLSSQLSHSLAELKQAQTQLIKSEKEKESENIRVRISRDIHDEVGATLSGVALFSEIAKQRMQEHNEVDAKIYLDHISTNSKDMVEKMGDIVWTINPENDSMERIVARLKAYTVNLCGGKGIQVHFQVDDGIKNFFPGMPERKNIYLFCKEAINNAVKYSNGSNIFFSILKNSNRVELEIKDDGKGFDIDTIVKGNGLINMQARATELNTAFNVQSKPGMGTCIKLHINFHPNGGHKEMV